MGTRTTAIVSSGMAIAQSVRERYDGRHVALFELGMKLPVLSTTYVPNDKTWREERMALARTVSAAELPAALFEPLFKKVDRGARGREVTAEVIALRASVLAHLRSH